MEFTACVLETETRVRNKSDQEGKKRESTMKERNNPRNNNPVEYSKNEKFQERPIISEPIPQTSQNIYFTHTKSLICPEHTNTGWACDWQKSCVVV